MPSARPTRSPPTADARREILENAAEYLQQARLYAQAAGLYEVAASSRHTPERRRAEALRAKAKAIAAAAPHGGRQSGPGRPTARGAAVVCRRALRQQGRARRFPRCWSSTATPVDVAAARQAVYRAVYPALETARENQVPPLRIVDGVMQAEFKVEGDAAARLTACPCQRREAQRLAMAGRHGAGPGPHRAAAAKPAVLNDPAWAAVVSGSVTQQSLDKALTAVKQAKPENAGLPADAGGRLCRVGQDARRPGKPSPRRCSCAASGWTTAIGTSSGRIAEQYGLNDLAAGLYRKVPSRNLAAGDDIYALAQRRLKKIEKR